MAQSLYLDNIFPLVDPLCQVVARGEIHILELGKTAGYIAVLSFISVAVKHLEDQRLLLVLLQREPAEFQELVESWRPAVQDDVCPQRLHLGGHQYSHYIGIHVLHAFLLGEVEAAMDVDAQRLPVGVIVQIELQGGVEVGRRRGKDGGRRRRD